MNQEVALFSELIVIILSFVARVSRIHLNIISCDKISF